MTMRTLHFLKTSRLLAVSLFIVPLTLTQCSKSPEPESETEMVEETPTETPAPETSESDDGAPPKLEDVIQGVWESSNLDRTNNAPEKIQIDFRANGELTMHIFLEGQSQQEGRYEIVDGKLHLHILGQEEDTVDTKFDGETLTIIDVNSEDEVDFQKL